MQPNYPNNPYSNAGVPSYGGQPYPYPQQMPPQMTQQGVQMSPNIQAAPVAVPNLQQMNAGSAIPPVMPNETAVTAHKKTTLADGTVLPDVIYVKKKGTLFALIATVILLIGCAGYAIYATLQNNSAQAKVEELTTKTERQEGLLKTTLESLGFASEDELTKENIQKLILSPEGAMDIDMTSFSDGTGVGVKSIRIASNVRYVLADVNYYGTSSYYYRNVEMGGWNFAFSRNGLVRCREITAEAMKVITDLGGVDKSVTEDGKPYDCIDTQDNNKLYDFPDALNAGVYQK